MAYYFPPQQKPQRWGNFQSVQYAIRKNSEKIYGVNPDSNVLVMPLFWGFPCLDFSGKQNHGTPYGGVAYHSGSLDFDGVDDYVGMNDVYYDSGTHSQITVSLWIYADNYVANDVPISRSFYPFAIQFTSASGGNVNYKTSVRTDVTGDIQPTTTGYPLTTGSWNLITLVYDGTQGINYLNGQNKISVQGTGNLLASPTYNIIIGNYQSGSSYWFDGLIDEVRISNIAPTAEQIALFYARKWDLYRRVGRTYYSVAAAPSIYIPQIMIF